MGGSGTTFSVHIAHPNHQKPTEAMETRVTRSEISVSCVTKMAARLYHQQQAASHVSVGEPAAAHVVQKLAGRDVGQEGVVEDQPAREPDVRQQERPEQPSPRLGGVRREERHNREHRPHYGVSPQERLLYGHPVRQHPQRGAG